MRARGFVHACGSFVLALEVGGDLDDFRVARAGNVILLEGILREANQTIPADLERLVTASSASTGSSTPSSRAILLQV
jgi:hypothetical protein